jgi:hypothetical protein
MTIIAAGQAACCPCSRTMPAPRPIPTPSRGGPPRQRCDLHHRRSRPLAWPHLGHSAVAEHVVSSACICCICPRTRWRSNRGRTSRSGRTTQRCGRPNAVRTSRESGRRRGVRWLRSPADPSRWAPQLAGVVHARPGPVRAAAAAGAGLGREGRPVSRGQDVSEGYESFVTEGAASLAASVAEREALSAPGVQQLAANYPPPANTPNVGSDPNVGPSPQPNSSPTSPARMTIGSL